MTRLFLLLLTLLFSLSGPAMGEYSDFWQSSNAARGTGQLDDAISAATPVGRRGQQATIPNPSTPQPRNVPGTVNGRDFSGHAFDRMQERGFTPSVVDNAIQRGTRTPGTTPGTFHHFDPANKLNVITDAATGRVITVF